MSSISPFRRLMFPPLVDDKAPHKVINVKRPHVAEDRDALIAWGRPSRFSILSDPGQLKEPFETFPGITVVPEPPRRPDEPPPPPNPDDPPTQQPPGAQVYHWEEMGRLFNVVRVENPDDSTQFVNIERIQAILFRAPDGSYQQFDLKAAEPGL